MAPEPQETNPATPDGWVVVEEAGAPGRFANTARVGRHWLAADEPLAQGGTDTGPSPYDYLLVALGSCTAMTLRLYADLKKWPLEKVEVRLKHDKIHAADCADCETREGKVDVIARNIVLSGPLDREQKARLVEIAERCPVHRTLQSEIRVETRLEA